MLTVAAYEELAFRGFLYCILDGLGGSRLAVWGTAVGFAAIHLDNNPGLYELLCIFLLGIMFAQLRRSTGSIVGLVGLHALLDFGWWILRPTGGDPDALAWLGPLLILPALIIAHDRRFHSLARDPRPRALVF
jgi:membrane protease YdiL (CAAX protease family)